MCGFLYPKRFDHKALLDRAPQQSHNTPQTGRSFLFSFCNPGLQMPTLRPLAKRKR